MTSSHRTRLLSRLPYSISALGIVLVMLSIFSFTLKQNLPSNAALKSSTSLRTNTDRQIERLRNRLDVVPFDHDGYVKLGGAYLQKARETGDISYYKRVEGAAQQALELNPDGIRAINLMGTMALALHNFTEAKTWADKAIAINLADADAYGILGDAQIELGQYQGAVENYQTMVNLKPDLASYARVSHIRNLMGDTDGAIGAMKLAVSAGSSSSEGMAWSWVQLGNLYFDIGQTDEAANHYESASRIFDGYHIALVGLGKARAAQGQYDEAISLYERATSVVPEPKTLAALGDLYMIMGDDTKAQHQYETIEIIAKLSNINGQVYNRDLSRFYADHDIKLDEALELAKAELEVRKDIYGYDALAWALHKNNRYAEAAKAIDEALKLGTEDANLYYHAGMIYLGNGEPQRASEHLELALELNPHFSILHAEYARRTLSEIRQKLASSENPKETLQ